MGDGAMLAPRSVLHAGVAMPPGEVFGERGKCSEEG